MRFFFTLTIFLIHTVLFAQNSYFQQEVNFKINVTLDDKKHVLRGDVEIEYVNNAPETLSFIYFMLYPQAYSSRNTAFAKQEIRNNKANFYFAETSEMGSMTELDFKVSGKKCAVDIDKDNPDIAKIQLPEPLKSGEKVIITTPFKVKIPRIFSRMGRSGQQYCISQWYPKPAVFDNEGWHPIPYLDQGEFYADFGKYDVTITLPENYVVGATGTLQTETEREFLNKKALATEGVLQKSNFITELTDTFPNSSTVSKTIRYTAEKVLDFAWFADKRFMVLKGDTILKSGKKVESYAYFPPNAANLWKNAHHFINRAVAFYSDLVGEYPHPQASAVCASEGSAGGMEYPMITLLAGMNTVKDVDGTIAHEVGHNWFQGIIGSNERDHAWMDEGLNSYYDHRYIQKYYQPDNSLGMPQFLIKDSDFPMDELIYQREVFKGRDQAVDVTSDSLRTLNYFLNAYERPAKALKLLENYYGTARFDGIMQQYYANWQFRHPKPNDFRKHLEVATGENLSWLFDDFFGNKKYVNYALNKIDLKNNYYILNIENQGNIAAPLAIQGIKNGKIVFEKWESGFLNKKEISIPQGDYDLVSLDYNHEMLDMNRNNNVKYIKGSKPIRLKWGLGMDNSLKNNLYWTPALALNKYDGAMIGVLIHNQSLPFKNFEFAAAPMFGTKSKQLAGVGQAEYTQFLGKNRLVWGLVAKKFSFSNTSVLFGYTRLTPSVTMQFQQPSNSNFSQQLTLKHHFVGEDEAIQDSIKDNKTKTWSNYTQLTYQGIKKSPLGNFSFAVTVENGSYTLVDKAQSFLKTTLTVQKDFAIAPQKFFSTRLFVGAFPYNSARTKGFGFTKGQMGLTANGLNDYLYDGYFLGRNETKGILSQQIQSATEGGMHFAINPDYARDGYFTNDMLATLSLKSDLPNLPSWLPLKPYMDFGYISDKRPSAQKLSESFIMSAGLALEWGDYLGIYMPLYFSGKKDDPNSFKNKATARAFTERIVFNLNLKKLNPIKLLREAGL